MTGRRECLRRGLTLVEMLASVVVIGVLCAAVTPVLTGATEAYARSTALRGAGERVGYAAERVVRLLRDAPPGPGGAGLGIEGATASSILFSDGRGVELVGTDLRWIEPAGAAVLLPDVEAFAVRCLGADGVTETGGAGATTQRFEVRVRASGFELRSAAFARVLALPGGGGP